MRVVKSFVAVTIGLLAVLVLGAPAHAGGPTSVLLVAPGSNAVGLYHSDPAYAKLRGLVGAPLPARTDTDERSHAEGAAVTVTWLIHDVRVWRVDRIYYEADGGPWIYTLEEDSGRSATGTWHRSPRPERLTSLLKRLDLTSGEYAGPPVLPEFLDEPAAETPMASDDETNAAAGSPEGREDPHSTDAAVSGWWWAGGGLLAGLLLAGAAVWLYPILRSGRPERQQVVDF